MASSEKDDIPMLQGFSSRNRSVSFSIPTSPSDSSGYEPNLVGFTGPLKIQRGASPLNPPRGAPKIPKPKREGYASNDRNGSNDMAKNEHLLRSGQLGVCNDPYCTTCPIFYNVKSQQKPSSTTSEFDAKVLSLCFLLCDNLLCSLIRCSQLDFELLNEVIMLYSPAFSSTIWSMEMQKAGRKECGHFCFVISPELWILIRKLFKGGTSFSWSLARLQCWWTLFSFSCCLWIR